MINSTILTDVLVCLDPQERHLLPEYKQVPLSRREKVEWEMNHGSLETEMDEKLFLRGRRNLQDVCGNEMTMRVNVTFDRVPAPTDEEVRRTTQIIMENL